MTLFTLENIFGSIYTTIIISCITTGLILTFATSDGISAGAIPFTVAACMIVLVVIMGILAKLMDYFEIP